ncbi:F1F0 ATP synthase subunit e, mitochondrial [Malassezia cuniculi]|uniref:ATP synthase F(0) complex subunit e, mitochondrial n=1 Tax=Malassezia cuniculi TaxID=948313 RepID=A0AAF0EVN0_9BASI|nr:F1F0 ATP synthase subunit e, mitochondrial [Malassezia cuniculi]
MSPTPVVNVVRYSALIGGIAYGVLHTRTLQKKYDEHEQTKGLKLQEERIKQAKAAYAKLQEAKRPPTADVITNPDDPNFDLEKLIESWDRE